MITVKSEVLLRASKSLSGLANKMLEYQDISMSDVKVFMDA